MGYCTTTPQRGGAILAGAFSDGLVGQVGDQKCVMGALLDGDPRVLGALGDPDASEDFDLDGLPENLIDPVADLLDLAGELGVEVGRTWTGRDLDGETQAAGAMLRCPSPRATGRLMAGGKQIAREYGLYLGGKEAADGWTLVYLSAEPGARLTTLLDDHESTSGYDDTDDFLIATAGTATLGAVGDRIRRRVADRKERRRARREDGEGRGLRGRRLARREDRLERRLGRVRMKLDRKGGGRTVIAPAPLPAPMPAPSGRPGGTRTQTKFIQQSAQYDPFAEAARYQQAAMMSALANAQLRGLDEDEAIEDIQDRLLALVEAREEGAEAMMYKPRSGRGFTAREVGRSPDGYLPPSLSMSGAYPDSPVVRGFEDAPVGAVIGEVGFQGGAQAHQPREPRQGRVSVRGVSPLPGGGEEDPVKLARFWRTKGIYMTAPYDKPQGPVIVRMEGNNWAPRRTRMIFPSSSRDLRFLGKRTHLSWPAGGQG